MDLSTSSIEVNAGPISQKELSAGLHAIAEKDISLAALFAARAVMRVFPFVMREGAFNFWSEIDRARFLLASWAAATLAFGLRIESDRRHAVAVVINECDKAALFADEDQFSFYIDYFGYAARSASDASIDLCVASAVNASSVYVDAAFMFDNYLYASLQNDLEVIKSKNPRQLFTLPLWKEPLSDSDYRQQLAGWLIAIQSLAEVESPRNKLAAELLTQIPSAYEEIFDGNYSQEKATVFTKLLIEYFEQSEKPTEKPQPKSKKASAKARKSKNAESATPPKDEPAQLTPRIYDYSATLKQCAEQPSAEDHLGRGKVCAALAAILTSPDNKSHQTIGLLGEWGSGKSSWVKLLEKSLKAHEQTQPYLISTFNAWSYEHTPNLQAGIAHEVIKTFVAPPKEKGFWARAWWNLRLKSYVAVAMHGGWKMLWLLLSFLFAVVPFGAMLYWMPSTAGDPTATATGEHIWAVWIAKSAGLFATLLLVYKSCAEQVKSLWAAPRAKELLTYLKMPSYAKHLGEIPEMRKTLETFCDVRLNQMTESKLEGGHTRLLLVVDDLDRCSHQGIVKVFEAVRLVLELDHVNVIIAVDQHIALAALALHYKDLAAHHKLASPRAIARDYLAKVIHLPITLNQPASSEVENLLQKIWQATEPSHTTVFVASSHPQEPSGVSQVFEPQSTSKGQAQIESESAPKSENIADTAQEKSSPSGQQGAQLGGREKSQESVQPEVPMLKVVGLSEDQKKAFIGWAQYFGLHNPRQLKRLNNTYNLLLSAHTIYDKSSVAVNSAFGEKYKAQSYPVLVALVTIEYLNSLESADLRKSLLRQLRSSIQAGSDNNDHPINEDFVAFFKALSAAAKIDLFSAAEPYVLPAIETDDDTKRYTLKAVVPAESQAAENQKA